MRQKKIKHSVYYMSIHQKVVEKWRLTHNYNYNKMVNDWKENVCYQKKNFIHTEKNLSNILSFPIYWKHIFTRIVEEMQNISNQKDPSNPFPIKIAELKKKIYRYIYV